jgi:hypothetical protein
VYQTAKKRTHAKPKSVEEKLLCSRCNKETTTRLKKEMCIKCYNKYIINPKWRPVLDKTRFKFKDKTVHAPQCPRVGVCNFCRAVVGETNTQVDRLCKRTNIAHTAYHDDNPLKDAIELCVSCHCKYDNSVQYMRR